MKSALTLGSWGLLANFAEASGDASYNYAYNGADWPANFPDCGGLNQSPIDLKGSTSTGFPLYKAAKDRLNKIYTNQVGDIKVGWTGDTTKVAINKEGQAQQTFASLFSVQDLGGGERFTGVQFHFHAGSEHTIDGRRFDLEMHTVHLAEEVKNDIAYAAVGILFDVNHYNAKTTDVQNSIIENFFESLKWDEAVENEDGLYEPHVTVDEVSYGDLMMMVDLSKRFVYKGSVTTPPCATYVYWNVLRSIYPIPQRFVDQFKAQLVRGDDGDLELSATGNWRQVQPYNLHNAKTMVTPEVINLYVDELIRDYFIFNGYTDSLASLVEESSTMSEEPTYTRAQIVARTEVNTTTQNVPIMYDLVSRELKPSEYEEKEAERKAWWDEQAAAAEAALAEAQAAIDGAVSDAVSDAADAASDAVSDAVSDAADAASDAVSDAADAASDAVDGAAADASDAVDAASADASAAVDDAAAAVSDILGGDDEDADSA